MPLLIMDVQVFSLDRCERFLTAIEGILQHDQRTIIKIPLCSANPAHGGPIIGERYSIHYLDGIDAHDRPPEFFYLGRFDQQLVFSTIPLLEMSSEIR